MAYGYTLLAPYFELDESPRLGNRAICRIRTDPKASRSRRSAAMRCAFRPTSPRRPGRGVVEALIAFTSPEAQKLYVETAAAPAPRYSVGADPEVRAFRRSSRPSTPCPGATSCSSGRARRSRKSRNHPLCGEELHDMLRGVMTRATRWSGPRHRADRMGIRENQSTREEDMDPNRLKGKNILITGAARGMGAANAEAFAAQGANVCLGDLNEDGRQRGRDRINAAGNGKAIAVKMDVTKREDNAAAVAATVEAFGSINVALLQRRPEQAPVLHGYRRRQLGHDHERQHQGDVASACRKPPAR
jgi:hypothetical protein